MLLEKVAIKVFFFFKKHAFKRNNVRDDLCHLLHNLLICFKLAKFQNILQIFFLWKLIKSDLKF